MLWFLFLKAVLEKTIALKERTVQAQITKYWKDERVNQAVRRINWQFRKVNQPSWEN